MKHPAHLTILRGGRTSEDLQEHQGYRGLHGSFGHPGPSGLGDESTDGLIHVIQVVVAVVQPEIDISQLVWDLERIIESEPLHDRVIRVGVNLRQVIEGIEVKRHQPPAFHCPEIGGYQFIQGSLLWG